MKPVLDSFFAFLINNYYSPLPFEEFATILEEWMDTNPDLAEEFGNVIGETLAQNILDKVQLNDDEAYIYIEGLQDYFPFVYDYAIARAHYDYLVEYFAHSIKTELAQHLRYS